MVFCGRPSTGCHACRARKTKCDAIPTGCTQCFNASRQCPGYRVQVDLIFREETKNVIKKAKVKHEKAKRKNAVTASSTSNPASDLSSLVLSTPQVQCLGTWNQQMLDIIIPPTYLNMMPSIEDRATAFFMSNYVIGDRGPTRGHLDRLADLYEADSIDDSLISAVNAVGLAGFSHSAKAPQLKIQARAQYTKALRLTNAALRDPIAVKSDSTLLAILILGLYETLTGTNQKSMKAWAEHIHGAAAVIKLRGPEAVKTVGGRRLLAQTTSSLLISCIQRDIPLPRFIVEMSNIAEKSINNLDPAWVAQTVMVRYTKFNARFHAGYYKDPHQAIADGLKIDADFLAFFADIPPGWEFKIIYTDADPDVVLNGCYHVYRDHWAAQIWNAIRELRILLHESLRSIILVDLASSAPRLIGPEYTAQLQISLNVMRDMTVEIIASVPQHIGYVSKFDETTSVPWKHFKMDEKRATEFPTVRIAGGMFILWPLFLVSRMATSPDKEKVYTVKILRLIGERMGIQQATMLANISEHEIPIETWREATNRPSFEELAGE